LTNAQTLQVNDAISVPGAGSTLVLTTTSGDLVINTPISLNGTVMLHSAGAIYQNTASAITAVTLTGSAAGLVSLVGANHITSLSTFSAGGL
jgi:hypothetical protein